MPNWKGRPGGDRAYTADEQARNEANAKRFDHTITRYRMRCWLGGDTTREARPSLAEVHACGYVVVERAALAAAWAALPPRVDDPLAGSEREAIVAALERPDGDF